MALTRRTAILAGLSAALTACAQRSEQVVASTSSTPPAPSTVAAGSTSTSIEPASATQPADRLHPPLQVDWIGGSDVAWQDASIPDAFRRLVPAVGGRTLAMRPRIGQALMPTEARALLAEAIAAGTEAMLMSFNLVWLHWDRLACAELSPPHRRYDCLLTPVSAAVTEQRGAEIRSMIDTAAAPGVPVYVYVQPHSSDALADPAVNARIAEAEATVATFDPGLAHVRLVAESFTRHLPPLREGVEFHDMVHPTPAGVEALAAWLATDVTRFWADRGLGG